MKPIPKEYLEPCANAGQVERLDYGKKFMLLYTPMKAAQIMREGMGTQFDPNMYLVFQSCQSKLERYYALAQGGQSDQTNIRKE